MDKIFEEDINLGFSPVKTQSKSSFNNSLKSRGTLWLGNIFAAKNHILLKKL